MTREAAERLAAALLADERFIDTVADALVPAVKAALAAATDEVLEPVP